MKEPKYKLVIAEGNYTADSLPSLMWGVFKHRLWHWWRGDGWVD